MDWGNRFAGVRVSTVNTNGSVLDGHIDLLVLKSNFEGEIVSSINADFKEAFQDYENFDYLNETEWISYCAFVKDANCFTISNYNFAEFANSNYEYKRLDDIKFIHIDSSGDTVKVSDIYNVPSPLFFQRFSNSNYYDETINEFQSDMKVEISSVFLSVVFFMVFLAILFSGIRVFVAYIIKLESITKLNFFIYFVGIYFIIFLISTELYFDIEFIRNITNGVGYSLLYYGVFFLIEVVVSYFISIKQINKEEYIKFSIYSYGIILLLILIIIVSMYLF